MNLNETLQYYFGYDNLKLEQEKIINSILDNKDTIGLLPTGYGKSITFQLPALILPGITLVVSPLIALMQDQVINLKNKQIKAEYINSLQTELEQELIYQKIKSGKVKILYVSAERLKTNKFINIMKNIEISLFVCDEAHTLLWSEDFREALGEIPKFINLLPKRPKMLALTATATNDTIIKIEKLLELRNPNIILCGCDRENIFYKIVKTNDKDRDLYFYLKNKINIHILIYCLTIKHVTYVYNYLKEKGFNCLMYHGALDSKEKKKILEQYKNHFVDIIVCTNAFGMGIDIPDIRYVIEYDLPQSIEDFSQQTGRASRDGEKGEALVLFNINDIKTINYFIDNIEDMNKDSKELKRIKESRRYKLDKMIKLCISSKCIHKEISEYFGIKFKNRCNMCSNCVNKKYLF